MAEKNTSIVLSDHWQAFIESQIATGRFASASEVVREGLRLAEVRQRKIDALDAAIQEGLDSGPPQDFDFDAFIADMNKSRARKAA